MDARAAALQVVEMEGQAPIWGVSSPSSLVQQLDPHESLVPVDHHPEDLEPRIGRRSGSPSASAMRLQSACTLSLGNTRKAGSDAPPSSAEGTPRAARSRSPFSSRFVLDSSKRSQPVFQDATSATPPLSERKTPGGKSTQSGRSRLPSPFHPEHTLQSASGTSVVTREGTSALHQLTSGALRAHDHSDLVSMLRGLRTRGQSRWT